MIKAKDLEYQIQAEFIRYVDLKYPDLLSTIAPAGFIMNAAMAIKMVRMGYKKGTPDWMCFEPRGGYHGLFIEFKKPGGLPSPEQLRFLGLLRIAGYIAETQYSAKTAIDLLERYFQLPVVTPTQYRLPGSLIPSLGRSLQESL